MEKDASPNVVGLCAEGTQNKGDGPLLFLKPEYLWPFVL
jgi:hypothetical protein